MTPWIALTYSFLFGLLHGILPDEHTWPITFSYAIGSGSGREGMKAGLYFSAAFTIQRTLLSELSYLALSRFMALAAINAYVYVVVGLVMSIAGAIVVRRNLYVHFHLLGHHHERVLTMEQNHLLFGRTHLPHAGREAVMPVHWTLIHGFLAGFGIGGFALFVNTVAAPAMPSAWIAFLPGLLFGLGTMLMLLAIGGLVGMSLRWVRSLSEQDVLRIGAQTGGRTLFFGGLLFVFAGLATLLGWDRALPVNAGYVLICTFGILVVIPAFVYSWKEVMSAKGRPQAAAKAGRE